MCNIMDLRGKSKRVWTKSIWLQVSSGRVLFVNSELKNLGFHKVYGTY